MINEIYVHPVPRLSDYLPDIEYYDNRFFRTRTGTNSRRGYCVAVSDGQGWLPLWDIHVHQG